MADNAPYQFSLTGREIELLLTSIRDKIDKNSIDQVIELSSTGIPATSKVKEELNKIVNATTGQGLKDAINNALDSNVFSDRYKGLLDQGGGFQFVGAPATVSERDNIDTTNYVGGETILLQSNEYGVPTVQFWNVSSSNWLDTDPTKAVSLQKTFNGTSKQLLISLPKTKFSIYTFKIMAKTNNEFHMLDVNIGLNYGGTVAYMTGSNDFYGISKLFSATVDYDGTKMDLSLTPTVSTINVKCDLISAY